MIILKHLTIERFRLLRSMSLHFPQRGSILIQGPNEAGKSALIESIYFALYGEALTVSRSKRSLDDLIFYGSPQASVSLTLSVGATELAIVRTIERGKGQQVSLQVSRLGTPDEDCITDLAFTNARIIAELGCMDSDALRNACLIEQKGLTRLETISGREREATISKLLGLERFLELTELFQVRPEDEQLLHDSVKRLHLAEIQARIPELSKKLDEIEAALDVVSVCDSLAEITHQEQEIREFEQTLEQIQARRVEFKSKNNRIQQLKRADATLLEIITSYDKIADARRMLPQLEAEIAELELREREDLPKLEKRVAELVDLTRSFGTLQRMSNDLLTGVDTIKELEQEVRRCEDVEHDLVALDEQIAQARVRLEKAQQSLQDLDARRDIIRPQLEVRLQRLNTLVDHLHELGQLEDQYKRRVSHKSRAEETASQLAKVRNDLRETEQELTAVEREATQAQKQASELENSWRKINSRRQLEGWYRLRGLLQGLVEAEQHLEAARRQQSQLTQAKLEAESLSRRYMLYSYGAIIFVLVGLIGGTILISIFAPLAIVSILVMLVFIGICAITFNRYRKFQKGVQEARQLEQEGMNRVGAMVAEREATLRKSSADQEALRRLEQEMRSFGTSIPQSLGEAETLLACPQPRGNLGEIQQDMKEKLDAANATRNQVNVTMEAVTSLRKERSRLEDLRQREQLDTLEEQLQKDLAAIERVQQEILLLASQENFPASSINARFQASPVVSKSTLSGSLLPISLDNNYTGLPELNTLVESTIRATEREMAILDGRLDMISDMVSQVKIHQDAYDVLVNRRSAVESQLKGLVAQSPELQLEQAREQQTALRGALQSLQDSLRQRVKPLGVTFGQAAISQAEASARKQLDELQFALGNKLMLQESHAHYTQILKECQESLSEHYKQLAKFSNTLGSWIVPPNPFAEALTNLRIRCQAELQESNEEKLLQDIEMLNKQEGASKAKISLCQQDILDAQDAIAALLAQRGRPEAKSFACPDLETVWPLLGQYTVEDRSQLEEERLSVESDLSALERQELELSQQLGTGAARLNLDEMRILAERQDRSYQTKKRGGEMIEAVKERLLSKMLPRTEYYMQQILPPLTGGRYHDLHLEVEVEVGEGGVGGGPYQIYVWDSAAGEYVHKSALSGGAADQLSLALRLAFAIATLPRELNAAPGFIFLDEPLSSFDRGRAQSLIDVVTGDILGQHFEQVILISNSSAFDPALFPYHIYVDNGTVGESNLPVVSTLAIDNAADFMETPLPISISASGDMR
jgi:DNA repair exonuclease SbcCD ATPase subunit